MLALIAADGVVLLHLFFILFVLAGGLLAIRWRWIVALHLPAVLWGAAVELIGWSCPLTPLENSLRAAGAEEGYSSGFIDHYIVPLIYPAGLTREIQIVLGGVVLLVNVGVYGYLIYRRRRPKAAVHRQSRQ
ncbi:MAG: hypothetical protein CL583_08330 [Alteromonadaceae bacterium]|nr:hypothetical protein [Alteromonadaceae bacterium]